MHYLRLLRPPVLAVSRAGASLSLVLTITTDLGESFLCPDRPIDISVGVETVTELARADEDGAETESDGVSGDREDTGSDENEPLPKKLYRPQLHQLVASTKDRKGKVGRPSWTPGLRVLKLDVAVPKNVMTLLFDPSTARRRLLIHTADESLSAVSAQQIVDAARGLIVPVWVDVPPEPSQEFPHVSIRKLSVGQEPQNSPVYIEVEEEIGESIARHVWDAGLAAVAFLAHACMNGGSGKQRQDGALVASLRQTLLSKRPRLRVLELGSGVGILGIGLATVLHECFDSGNTTILLTDLPEAEERAVSNMQRSQLLATRGSTALHNDDSGHGNDNDDASNSAELTGPPRVRLEYENLDWDEGCHGVFGRKVTAGGPWDLVVLSDCTYNVDMLPALVQTLSALQSLSSPCPLGVLLARKPRHSSEEALFSLMPEHGWKLQASDTLLLPVLSGEGEVVEIYHYVKGGQ